MNKHILKVHKNKSKNINLNQRNKTDPKTLDVFDEKKRFAQASDFLSKQISDWINKYLPNCYNSKETKVLTLMFLINDLKYDFSVIHKYIAQWNEEEYIQISEKLNILYKNIKVDFSENEKQLQKEIYSKRDIEWSELNGYEIRFSKSY